MSEQLSSDIESLIESEKTFLWSQALWITRKTEDAEDLFQDTIMKVCKSYDSFKRDTNFRAWARKIMINTHINRMRLKMLDTMPYEDFNCNQNKNSSKGLLRASNMDDPENVFFHNHISEKIMWHFYSLPEEYKTVFSLFHFNEYTYAEISRVVKIPVGTVKSRIHRARQCLKNSVLSEPCLAGNTRQ